MLGGIYRPSHDCYGNKLLRCSTFHKDYMITYKFKVRKWKNIRLISWKFLKHDNAYDTPN